MPTWRVSGFIVLGILLAVCGCEAPRATSAELSDEAIREILRERVESGRYAAIVVGILEDGKRRTIAYGVQAAGADSVDEHTVFEIGSITKVFTASLLAEMVRRGEAWMIWG